MASNNANTLLDEKLAVSLFLDSLLREPEVELATPETKPVTETPSVTTLIEEKTHEVKLDIPEQTVIEAIPEIKLQQDVIIENKVQTEVALNEEEATTAAVVPEWANEPFQILLFEVAGLKLAVPLIDLCGVIEWKDTVTEMPGHADFYMVILQHLDYTIAVIDPARMVLPTNKLVQLTGNNPRFSL